MSVPLWKRKLSSADFLYKPYYLNIRLGQILANKPKKYKTNYTDHIIKTALSALQHLQTADSIYLSKYTTLQEYEIRHEALLLARGEIENVATACYVFLEIVRKNDFASDKQIDEFVKIYDQELEIGGLCEDCYNLISGLIKSDRELYRTYIAPKK